MSGSSLAALAVAAVSVGTLHTLAPDHWVPFAAVARARGWSAARTARVTALCGFGHVTVSVLLGVLALVFGLAVLEAFGRRLESVAGLVLIGFGLAYGLWGLRRVVGARVHGHPHARYDHVHDPSRVSAWGLFAFFAADPCVAVIPIVAAAAPLGAGPATAVVLAYEAATIGTMLALVLPARAGARALRAPWLGGYGDALAGGVIVAVGLIVSALGW
jgi:nickel/cobalt transporter (NicO) family protein